MSEYISVCPKCLQNILCDTAYTGKRVACPVCMQEIIMPAPTGHASPAGSAQVRPSLSQSGPAPATATNGSKGKFPVLAIVGVAAVLTIVASVLAFGIGKRQPAPVAAAVPPAAATPPVVASSSVPDADPDPSPTAPPAAAPAKTSGASVESPAPAAPVIPTFSPGRYKIVNRLTGLCLDVTTNISSKGSNVLKAVLSLDNGEQVWDIRACGTNQYSLLSPMGPSLELPVSKQNGAQLELARWVHVPREVWTLVPTPDGYFQIACAASGGRVAEALGGTDGRQIVVQDAARQGSLNQQWSFQAP